MHFVCSSLILQFYVCCKLIYVYYVGDGRGDDQFASATHGRDAAEAHLRRVPGKPGE